MTPTTHDGRPVAADFTVAQRHDAYSAEDHATWRALHARQRALLPGRVHDDFLAGLDRLGIGADGIPDFERMNAILKAATGFTVVAVPGLVPDEVFFRHLAERRFPSGYWIRRPDQMDYIEEPDVFHDVFGHVPLLMDQGYADYVAAYGRAGLAALAGGALHRLARLYWYTVEFGLIDTPKGLRIFGSGIASSPGETVFALESPSPNRVGFDLARVMRTEYRIDDYQETYFVLRGLGDLPDLSDAALAPVFAALEGTADIAPGDLAAGDRVLTKGDGAYHRGRAA
jgi:phenylalanine-4-hydroxylase